MLDPPLYDPRHEHDACGLGALARLDGRPTHELLQQALAALVNLGHRGATGADPFTGDGAGIMTQLPDRFLRDAAGRELGLELPPPGAYAAGLVFLPRDPALRQRCEELCVRICAEEGHRALGWRDPPVRAHRLGELARASEPVVRQLFVQRRTGDEDAFERKLYVIRRRVERAAAAAGVPEADFTIVSLSARRLVYKGLLTAPQLAGYYDDLTDPRFETALALVHSRFSTNTFGTWDLAHPFNLLAHNGEINTVRGNANWLAAREPQLRSELLVVDTAAGRVSGDRDVKRALSRRRPYRAWLDRHRVLLEDLPPRPAADLAEPDRRRLLDAFGYTAEELELIVGPLARSGAEPVGSMGDDAAPAVLSSRPRLLAGHFKQQFAQVTNPPIDPQREALVMSLQTSVGPIGNMLEERPDHCRRIILPRPVVTGEELERLRHVGRKGFEAVTLGAVYPVAGGPDGLERAVDGLCAAASRAVWDGATIVILSDRGVDAELAPVPPLLATAAVHSHLVREGARTMCGLVVDSGEPRETMHVALLLGYGAAAVCPYLALETLPADQRPAFVEAIGRGLAKVCSKMGISTIQSYRGAQIFEAVGLGPGLIERYFPGTASHIGGIELADVHSGIAARHAAAFPGTGERGEPIELGGEYRFRVDGQRHVWTPTTVARLQRAVRDAAPSTYAEFAREVDEDAARAATLRGLLELVPAAEPLPLSAVEPGAEIVRRFATGAMSLGAISPEAHETLAIAMNRLGGRSNCGEGGEDPARSVPDRNGDLRRSAIKQVASGRFGVTAAYLADADQLQIKIAQGAKPGEGGQLPGTKVDETIARLRHAMPGVGLISPPPHHDIYSIEDLAQLIHDLRCVNPAAEISVKLVAESGVGTIAAGVAKAGADHIVIAGHDGGTGAAPLSSIKHAGLPWELGLAEAQQVLVRNRLRDRVRLQADGGLRAGRDVVVAALLGADEFGFSTAPLVAAGCVMMRVCHLNTCPVGIATQDPELRRRFTGTPDDVVRYFVFIAEHVRELLATLGIARLEDAVGRGDLLRPREDVRPALAGIDLSPLIATRPDPAPPRPRRGPPATLDAGIVHAVRHAIDRGAPAVFDANVSNTDRSVGAAVAGEIARRAGAGGLPDGAILRRPRRGGGRRRPRLRVHDRRRGRRPRPGRAQLRGRDVGRNRLRARRGGDLRRPLQHRFGRPRARCRRGGCTSPAGNAGRSPCPDGERGRRPDARGLARDGGAVRESHAPRPPPRPRRRPRAGGRRCLIHAGSSRSAGGSRPTGRWASGCATTTTPPRRCRTGSPGSRRLAAWAAASPSATRAARSGTWCRTGTSSSARGACARPSSVSTRPTTFPSSPESSARPRARRRASSS